MSTERGEHHGERNEVRASASENSLMAAPDHHHDVEGEGWRN